MAIARAIATAKYAAEAQEAEGEKADKLPIPTVSFDSEAGTWVIEVPLADAGLGKDLTIR